MMSAPSLWCPVGRGIRRRARSVLGTLALFTSLNCDRCNCGKELPLAHVEKLSGDVQVAGRDTPGTFDAAKLAQGLFVEDTISTGADAGATVTFRGGTSLVMGPNTSLVIRPLGGASAELGAVLVAGEVQAKTDGKAPPVMVQTPLGVARLGTRLSELILSVERGVRVQVGSVEVALPQGGEKTIVAGKELTIGGLQMDVGGAIAGLELGVKKKPPRIAPKIFSLMNPQGGAQVQSRGTQKWQSRPSESNVESGDRVRVAGRQNHAAVRFKDGGTLRVEQGEVEFPPADETPDEAPDYHLHSERATLQLVAVPQKKIEHVMHVDKMTLRVRPTVQKADVDVEQQNGQSSLAVRFGELALGDNQVVEAGSLVQLANGKVKSIEPLTPFRVDVKPGAPAVVYYKDAVPAVNFVWSATKTEPQTLELAKDDAFNQVVAAEKVTRGSLILDRLTAGRYNWRVDGQNDTGGELKIAREPTDNCARCQRLNTINDNGEETLVYYQQKFPEIVLAWPAVPNAKGYRLQAFRENNLDKPIVDQQVRGTSRRFVNGQPFGEGHYHWLATPLGIAPTAYHAHLTPLTIIYDNALTTLLIRGPQQNARLKKVVARGEVQVGAQVFVGGKKVTPDKLGRFAVEVPLPPGQQQVVFRSIAKDGVERIYLRDVTVFR